MSRLKRGTCILLAALMLVVPPAESYGAATAAVFVGGYALEHVLAVCGVLVGSAAVAVLVGTWDDADTYRVQGAAGKLGSYAQRVYDGARGTAGAAAERYRQIEETLIALVTSEWGDTVAGIRLLVDDLKLWLRSLYGYGYAGREWQVPTVPVNQVWCETEWSSLEPYPLPSSPAALVPPVANDPDYTLFLTNYLKSPYAGTMNVLNWYFAKSVDVFGVYDPVTMTLATYQRNAGESTYADYPCIAYSAYVNGDGTLRYNVSTTDWWRRPTMLCVPDDAGSLPFPVFSSVADAEHYVATGEAVGTYVSGTVPMRVDAFREDVAAVATDCISDVFTLPDTEDVAAGNLALLESSYADAMATDLGQVITGNGLAVGVTDMPVDGTDQEVIGAIGALPGQIADAMTGLFGTDTDKARQNLSLPAMVANKFPFCIPFDFIYLVKSLAAEREVPVFEFPVRLEYRDFHYEHTFILNMSVFDPAIHILRVMLDLLFCSWLIAATRHMIRG